MVRTAIAALLATAEARVLHQTGNPAATMPTPPGTERRHDARTAVGLATLLVNGRDLRGQRLIFQGPRSGHRLPLRPSVVAAGGHLKILAELQDGMVSLHRLHPSQAFGDGAERMPNVF